MQIQYSDDSRLKNARKMKMKANENDLGHGRGLFYFIQVEL